MRRSIPPRLRAPMLIFAGGAVIAAVATGANGWGALLYLAPFIVIATIGYYVWGGRDTDAAALLRNQADERQAYRRLKIQALVGRVTSGAAAVAYLAAFAAKVTLWPFAIFLAIPCVTLLAGWAIYRDGAPDSSSGMGRA
jgi:hypothetical protein